MQNKPKESFLSIFQVASKHAKLYFDSDITCPCIAKKQIHRKNYVCDSAEEYPYFCSLHTKSRNLI